MFVKLVEIIIQKLHKVNMKQRSFITIFRLVGECYEQDNSSFRYELLLRKCRDVASSGTCRKADGSWGRSGSKTWNCADCELYCKASRSKNRYGIVAGKAGLPGNNFCTASHGSLFEIFQNGTGDFSEYTDQREPFGIDESWLDVTASTSIKGDGMKIAKEISSRIKYELGVTVSIGVSWNKIIAKLGSDYKKPDAITEFSKDNYKDIAWKLPVGELLMVGRSTERTMKKLGICTIGDLAGAEPSILETYLGKMGLVLHTFANGWDETPVSVEGYKAPIKSIGNSTTTPRDLVSELDVKIILMALSESVGARLRENGFQCRTVEISIRDNGLYHFTRQCKLDRASNLTEEIARTAFGLFQKNYNWEHPIRSLGVRGCDLVSEEMPYQLDLFMDETKREKIKKMDQVVDKIRGRFGYQSIQRAFMYQDKILAQLNAKEHTVHPQAYFHG